MLVDFLSWNDQTPWLYCTLLSSCGHPFLDYGQVTLICSAVPVILDFCMYSVAVCALGIVDSKPVDDPNLRSPTMIHSWHYQNLLNSENYIMCRQALKVRLVRLCKIDVCMVCFCSEMIREAKSKCQIRITAVRRMYSDVCCTGGFYGK